VTGITALEKLITTLVVNQSAILALTERKHCQPQNKQMWLDRQDSLYKVLKKLKHLSDNFYSTGRP